MYCGINARATQIHQPKGNALRPSREISRLVEIMAALRTPRTGCPWDLEQDFASISAYTIEEAYEVADAIERGDWDDLCDELGDLLLQPIYHARMAEEAGLFDFSDVIEAITTKLIRRHPHVFGDQQAHSAGMAKGAWEKIKAQESAEAAQRKVANGASNNTATSLLDNVPSTLPALQTAVKLQKKAARVGFDWANAEQVMNKLREEVDETSQAIAGADKKQIEGEIGDLLFTIANLCRHLDLEPDKALRVSNLKFRQRFTHIEHQLADAGSSIETATGQEMETLWQQAKKLEK